VPCLDGLRALSIVLVLLFHGSYTHGFCVPFPIDAVAHHGDLGVDIFFAISGFLITLLLLRELSDTGAISLRQFYLRRSLRILPVYVSFVLVAAGLASLGAIALNRQEWRGLLTYTMNFVSHPRWEVNHAWSLSMEEQFYLLWPPILALIGPRRARWVALGCLVGIPLLRAAIWGYNLSLLQTVPDRFILKRIDCITAGCLLALLAGDPVFRRKTRLTGRAAGLLAFLFILVLASSPRVAVNSFYNLAIGHPLNAVSIAGLLWICANHAESLPGRILRSRLLTAMGVLSYSLYIWQELFMNLNSTCWACRWPMNVCLAALTAAASYVLIEAPFLRLKQRISRRNAGLPDLIGSPLPSPAPAHSDR
jgi:peptidoglycan/LPS O-acetylase OafA/YrhL